MQQCSFQLDRIVEFIVPSMMAAQEQPVQPPQEKPRIPLFMNRAQLYAVMSLSEYGDAGEEQEGITDIIWSNWQTATHAAFSQRQWHLPKSIEVRKKVRTDVLGNLTHITVNLPTEP